MLGMRRDTKMSKKFLSKDLVIEGIEYRQSFLPPVFYFFYNDDL